MFTTVNGKIFKQFKFSWMSLYVEQQVDFKPAIVEDTWQVLRN